MRQESPVRVPAVFASHRVTEDLGRVAGRTFQLVAEDEDQPVNAGGIVARK
jgi:hypothetical protein